MGPYSGLQRESLALYRTIIRAIRSKPAEQRPALHAFARGEFEAHRGVSPKNLQLMEHLLRKGRKQLQMLSQAEVQGVAFK